MAKDTGKTSAKEYGMRWIEFDRRTGRMVKEERFFASEADLDRFIEKTGKHPPTSAMPSAPSSTTRWPRPTPAPAAASGGWTALCGRRTACM